MPEIEHTIKELKLQFEAIPHLSDIVIERNGSKVHLIREYWSYTNLKAIAPIIKGAGLRFEKRSSTKLLLYELLRIKLLVYSA